MLVWQMAHVHPCPRKLRQQGYNVDFAGGGEAREQCKG